MKPLLGQLMLAGAEKLAVIKRSESLRWNLLVFLAYSFPVWDIVWNLALRLQCSKSSYLLQGETPKTQLGGIGPLKMILISLTPSACQRLKELHVAFYSVNPPD